MRRILVLAAVAALLPSFSAARDRVEKLAGTRWRLEVEAGGLSRARGEKDFVETVVFDGDKVEMVESSKRGFAPSTYTEEKDGNKILVVIDQQSPTEGSMHWEGDIRDGWFKGVLLWKKPDGHERNYLFRGEQAKPEKKSK